MFTPLEPRNTTNSNLLFDTGVQFSFTIEKRKKNEKKRLTLNNFCCCRDN